MATTRKKIHAYSASQELVAAESTRRGLIVHNGSTKTAYLLIGEGEASAADYTLLIAAGGFVVFAFGDEFVAERMAIAWTEDEPAKFAAVTRKLSVYPER